MTIEHGRQDLDHEPGRGLLREGPHVDQPVEQLTSLAILGDQVIELGIFGKLVDADDVGMILHDVES